MKSYLRYQRNDWYNLPEDPAPEFDVEKDLYVHCDECGLDIPSDDALLLLDREDEQPIRFFCCGDCLALSAAREAGRQLVHRQDEYSLANLIISHIGRHKPSIADLASATDVLTRALNNRTHTETP